MRRPAMDAGRLPFMIASLRREVGAFFPLRVGVTTKDCAGDVVTAVTLEEGISTAVLGIFGRDDGCLGWVVSSVGEGGEFVGDAEEEDGADGEAVGDGEGGGDGLEAGEMAAGGKEAAGAGGHEGIHGEQAEDEAEQAKEALRGAAELGGEEEEKELRGGFGAEAVDDADEEDGGVGVVEAEVVGAGEGGVGEAPGAPAEVTGS